MAQVSVIIPVYNVEKYLSRCLDSLLAQTFADFEVICVNDGSTDGSGQILEEYAQKDVRIKVLTQKNQGQSIARNKGLDIAIGEYVYFVDSDDFIHTQTLEILLAVAQKTKSPVIAFPETKKYCADKININCLKYVTYTNPLKQLLKNVASSSVVWNKLYSAEIVKNFYFIEGIYFEDWPWVTCLFSKIERYTEVPYKFYYYNTSNESTVRSVWTVRKLQNYATGIKTVTTYFQQPMFKKYWPTVRKKRIIASIKMMINKTYKENINQEGLDKALLQILRDLKRNKSFYWRELPLKVLFRLFKIKLRNLEKNNGKI